MEIKECPVCNCEHVSFFAERGGFVFFKCHNCNLVFMNPLPDAKELISNFYSQESGYHATLASNVKEIKKYNKKFTKVINGLHRLNMTGNLLDVGCSNGEFLFLAKKHGFKTYGVEANAYTAGIASDNGLDVFCGTLEAARFADNYFSVIYLGDIIEHVNDPVGLLKECKRILKKGGVIAISTPNTDCFWVFATQAICHWFQFPWSVLLPPYHVYLFSGANIEKLIHALHLEVLSITYAHFPLRHELGGTGLLKKFRSEKSIAALFYMALVFGAYILVYVASFLLKPVLKKDFEMIVFVRN